MKRVPPLHLRRLHPKWTALAALRNFSSAGVLGLLGLLPQHLAVAQQQPSTPLQSGNSLINTAQYRYQDPSEGKGFLGNTNDQSTGPVPLVDPLGRILGCSGQPLPDYTGFSMMLYEADLNDPTGTELGRLVTLSSTEVPDIPNNGVPGGLLPNRLNVNPFALSNAGGGRYNFLLDPERGQLNPGRTYVLVISPPPNSIYQERRIKLEIVDSTGSIGNNIVRYVATSLDGQPISAEGGTQITQNAVFVPNAEQVGLDLLSLQIETLLCEPNQVSITKTADRATAQPGDIVLYRLAVRNQSDSALEDFSFTDTMPRGLKLVENSVKAAIAQEEVAVTSNISGNVVSITTITPLPPDSVMNVIYAAQVTPDAVRGSGRNSVVVNANRSDNSFAVKDGPAIHELRIRTGILSDYGILMGRVFEDKNFDGEQQRGEPGLPNAVIFLQDGNRVTTDENGLFSVANVQPGYHSGVLDLRSVPGYKLAPNSYRREFNSGSRLVRLAPGGMARMNFPVAPMVASPEAFSENNSAIQEHN